MKEFNFEVYTINPVTKETGWDIRFVSVLGANTKEQARELLRLYYPEFDEVISFNYGGMDLSGYELELYSEGAMFVDRHSYMNHEITQVYYR